MLSQNVFCPDITAMVDWVLNINCLSVLYSSMPTGYYLLCNLAILPVHCLSSGLMKFDPTKVKDELSDTEFSSLFRDADRAKEQEMGQDVDMR